MNDIFKFRNELVENYRKFSTSFANPRSADVATAVKAAYDGGRFWPDPLIQVNPNYRRTKTIAELVANKEDGKLERAHPLTLNAVSARLADVAACTPGEAEKALRVISFASEPGVDVKAQCEDKGYEWRVREFSLEVDLDESGKKPLHYEVRYADFCYAVGKALTEALKAHGFAGFNAAVWESDVNVRHLCFLKACGLGVPEAMQPIESAAQDKGEKSSLADELELLLFDM